MIVFVIQENKINNKIAGSSFYETYKFNYINLKCVQEQLTKKRMA